MAKKYLDLYLLPIPKTKLARYQEVAKAWGRLGKKHGMVDYWESTGTVLAVPGLVPFSRAVKLKKGEVLVAAVATFKSKAHRDRVVKKMEKDPKVQTIMKPDEIIFDVKRMIVGEFSSIVSF